LTGNLLAAILSHVTMHVAAGRPPEALAVTQHKKLAILVGGGPAPGINSVISARPGGRRRHSP